MTDGPHAEWVIQQLRDAFPYDTSPRYLIYDRDSTFSPKVTEVIKSMGIKPVRTAYRSPWQNGFAERWIGSLRRELLDHVVVFNEEHLIRLIRDYLDYYHDDRTHLSLGKDCPNERPIQHCPSSSSQVVALPRVGGLHHRYVWKEAA